MRFPALALVVLAGLTAPAAAADAILPSTLLGASVTKAIAAYGVPSAVTSRSDGHHFFFDVGGVGVDAIVDAENGTVRALDVRGSAPATLAMDVDGKPRTFGFGTYAATQADADLANVADYSLDAQRLYRLSPARELVLGFEKTTGTLARVVVGDRSALVRLNVFPNEPVEKTFPFVAPKLRGSGLPKDGMGARVTIVRLDVDRTGAVTEVGIVVPSEDAAYDAFVVKKIAGDTYVPAKLGIRPIASSVYREFRH